jgi:hypothetical protein
MKVKSRLSGMYLSAPKYGNYILDVPDKPM